MSSLKDILNPREELRISCRFQSDASEQREPTKSPPTSNLSTEQGETLHYLSESLPSTDHDRHPDCPDTLDCLPDTDGRPQHTLPVILRCAVLGSPRKRLTIREIYNAMEEKYPYYKTAGPTWKQSVRHHLSLNRLFERQPRPVTDPGFGSYWTVNLTAPPGTKRPRKRGRPNKEVQEDREAPPVKRRGRPPKATVDADLSRHSSITATKYGQSSTIRGDQSEEDDYGDDVLTMDDKGDRNTEDEYESEEDMVYPFVRTATSSLDQIPSSSISRASTKEDISEFPPSNPSNNTIDRLRIEMAGLKRQSSEAVAVSLRMSDQLAEAQAEASRARAALRAAESMLEDEARKRREAERQAIEEAKMRRVAEETLIELKHQSVASPR